MPLKETQEQEQDLIRLWKAGDKKALPKLYQSMRPIENAWYRKLPAHQLPESAVRGEIKKQMYDAFKTYNSSKGVKLSTYVNSKLPKVYRYVSERQNIGRIPEHRALKITSFIAAKDILEYRTGREPSAAELADELAWDLKEVERLQKELRKDVILTSEMEEALSFNDSSHKQQILNLAYYELSPREKKVFEWSTGWAGAKPLSTKEIAKKLKVSIPTVGNVKRNIANTIEGYIR